MTTAQKFSSCIDILSEIVDRQVTLDIEYPIIYNQVVKFYEEKGVDFYGDVDEDYDILLSKLNRTFFIMNQVKVLLERFPYRYVSVGMLDNGHPDYRIQKANEYTKRYSDMYLLDNQMQLLTAMEDFEYTKWLDPETVPCYIKDNVSA